MYSEFEPPSQSSGDVALDLGGLPDVLGVLDKAGARDEDVRGRRTAGAGRVRLRRHFTAVDRMQQRREGGPRCAQLIPVRTR